MRLIDADRMKRNIVDDGGHETAAELRTWVDNQITVDAIPVEWLRSVHENWLLTPDEMEFRDWLIERWQKEQEAQDE